MAEHWQRQSPLTHLGLSAHDKNETSAASLVMAELRFLAKVTLRGRIPGESVRTALGVSLPGEPNTVMTGNNLSALWLGPDEWLIVGPPDAERAMTGQLAKALPGTAVVDVTEGRTTIRTRGPMVLDILAMGCPLDLHPRAFGPGRCAQSTLGRSPIILHQVDGAPLFDIHVERSQADYLWTWLETAGRPYGVAVEGPPAPPPGRRPAPRRSPGT
ncbi:MAG: sarcosine oxidase subunit gamma [bacterium]|nr:sarcosine oxidase subunit gamma [bacterium]